MLDINTLPPSVIMQAVPIVAQSIAESVGVSVSWGHNAKTNGKTIFLPYIDLSQKKYANIIFGFMVHEASHVINTNMQKYGKFAIVSPLRGQILNIVEDIYIEKEIMKLYPYVRSHLDQTLMSVDNEGGFTAKKGDTVGIFQWYLLSKMRNDSLTQNLQSTVDHNERLFEETFPLSFKIKIDSLMTKAHLLSSTDDSIEMAEVFVKMIEDESEDEPEDEEDEDDKSEPDKSDDDSDDSGDKSDSNEKGDKSDSDDSDNSDEKGDKSDSDDSDASDEKGDKSDSNDSDDSDEKGDKSDSDEKSKSSNVSNEEEKKKKEALKQLLSASEGEFHEDIFEKMKEDFDEERRKNPKSFLMPDSLFTVDHNGIDKTQDVKSTSNAIATQVRMLLQSKNKKRKTKVSAGVKINSSRLAGIPSGRFNVFDKKTVKSEVNTAISLLIDTSGSMRGEKLDLAQKAALAFSLSLDNVQGVANQVSHFPYRNGVGVIKSFSDKVLFNTKKFSFRDAGCTPMASAILGTSLDLIQRKEPRKIMIVLTDGDPDDAGQTHTAIKQAKSMGIEIIAIGIQYSNVSRFFNNFSVIKSLAELQPALFSILRKSLNI